MSDHAENSDVLELFGSGANAIDLDAIRARWEAATPGPWEVATGFSSEMDDDVVAKARALYDSRAAERIAAREGGA